VGESLPGWQLRLRLTRKLGPKVEEVAAAGRWKAFPWPLIFGNPGIKLRHN
jgi:hypothetical protein